MEYVLIWNSLSVISKNHDLISRKHMSLLLYNIDIIHIIISNHFPTHSNVNSYVHISLRKRCVQFWLGTKFQFFKTSSSTLQNKAILEMFDLGELECDIFDSLPVEKSDKYSAFNFRWGLLKLFWETRLHIRYKSDRDAFFRARPD